MASATGGTQGDSSIGEEKQSTVRTKRMFEGMALPEYLDISELPNAGGIKIRLDLGLVTEEGKRRLEEIAALKTKQSCIPLMEIDGPRHLLWEEFTQTIARLLLKRNVHKIAVPPKQVDKIQGRLSGLVMGTVRSSLTGAALAMAGMDVNLRDVISASVLTSRIVQLCPESEEVINLKVSVRKMKEEKFVPKPLRAMLCGLVKVIRKNERSERVKAQRRKRKEGDSNRLSDRNSVISCSSLSDYSISDTESTGFDLDDRNLDMEEGPSDNDDICRDQVPLQPGPSKYVTEPKYEICSDKCYICKKRSQPPKHPTPATKHYDRLCPGCAEINWSKRHSGTSLDGYSALVTGGRIKIGYETVLKLLRDGCQVITTTRFPLDASKRYAAEPDYDKWKDRLKIYPLELKDSKGIYLFVEYLKQTLPHLDIIINNAAQTIRRPFDFYQHLLEYEQIPDETIPDNQRLLIATSARLTYRDMTSESMVAMSSETSVKSAISPGSASETRLPLKRKHDPLPNAEGEPGPSRPAKKTRYENLPGPENTPESWSQVVSRRSDEHFPVGCLDEHGQQIDLRSSNSWRAVLEEVPISELLEVLMVNAIAPYILNKELKDLMVASPHNRRFIVNVSAMEGQFHRLGKTRYHPHTNMAKAALNMMTRTGALGYREDHIYMTSVDTGWVTDERPFSMAVAESKKGFVLPLDTVDGAARVYDPVVMGLTKDREPYYAVFLKNYASHPW